MRSALLRVHLVLERVNDGDVRIDFDWLTVENCWAVVPLGHGVLRGAQEERVAADDLQRLDRPVGGNDGVKHHLAFAMSLYCER